MEGNGTYDFQLMVLPVSVTSWVAETKVTRDGKAAGVGAIVSLP